MNHEQARRWLDNAWNLVLSSGLAEPDTKIDRLVDSDVQSIRYAHLAICMGTDVIAVSRQDPGEASTSLVRSNQRR